MIERHRVDDPPPLLRLYLMCQELKSLPYPGSIAEQPARVMEAFSIIQNAMAEAQIFSSKEVE